MSTKPACKRWRTCESVEPAYQANTHLRLTLTITITSRNCSLHCNYRSVPLTKSQLHHNKSATSCPGVSPRSASLWAIPTCHAEPNIPATHGLDDHNLAGGSTKLLRTSVCFAAMLAHQYVFSSHVNITIPPCVQCLHMKYRTGSTHHLVDVDKHVPRFLGLVSPLSSLTLRSACCG